MTVGNCQATTVCVLASHNIQFGAYLLLERSSFGVATVTKSMSLILLI